MPTTLRPRSGTEIIDAAFTLFRRHYTQFVVVAAVLMIPSLILRVALPMQLAFIPSILAWMAQSIASGAVIVLVSQAYLGEPVEVGAALGAVGSRWGAILLVTILQGLVVGVGFVLLIIPGFIFFAWSFAMPMVVVLEGSGASESWERSRLLAKGDVGRILLILGLAFLLFMIVNAVVGALLGVGLGLLGLDARVVQVLSQVIVMLVYPIYNVIATLLYYDLRIRKEGFDLEILARELGTSEMPIANVAPGM